MLLPDCYEGHRQAEALEVSFDQKCEELPRCAECEGSLYRHDTYTELGGQLYCEKCTENNTHSVDRLEVLL